MVNWYYVRGSERVGPVDEKTLKDLFYKEEINQDSYIWRKGFQKWERVKNVEELKFNSSSENKKSQKETKENSPEIIFNFEWENIRNEDELFFIKIGSDRKDHSNSELFGPYSLNELHDAIQEKRINNRSLIFAAGMPGWIEVGKTPLDSKNLKLDMRTIENGEPLLMVIENDPLPLMALVKEASEGQCVLLGTGAFQVGKMVLGSIYQGTSLKAKNIKLNIEEYRPHEQKVFCRVIDINENAKNIIKKYAEQ
jgi:hypothetical protein